MGYFTDQIITKSGVSALARAEAGETTLTFTRVKTGNGTYSLSEVSKIENAADLKSIQQIFPVTGISVHESTILVKTVISNDNLVEGYNINEIGIFGKEDDGEEKLIAISICSENPTYLPAYKRFPIEIPFTDHIAHSGGNGNFTVNIQSETYVQKDELEDLKKRVERKVLTGTLKAGETSLTLTSDVAISADNLIDVYADAYGVLTKSIFVDGRNIELTFKAQSSDINIKAVIS